MLKVAVAFENFAGAGHAGIVSKLAREIDQIGGETVCMTGSGLPDTSGRFFNFPATTEFVALPTIQKDPRTGRAELTSRGLTYDQDQIFQMQRTDLIINGLRTHRPQILITDSWPWGKGNLDVELIPVLDEAKKLGIDVIPMVRDVGFYPNHRKDMTQEQIDHHIFSIVNNQTHSIIVTGDQNLFRMEDWYPKVAQNITTERLYPGYFSEPPKHRRAFLNEQDRPVVFSLGGGFIPNPDLDITEAVLTNHEKGPYKNNPLWFFVSQDCPERHLEQIRKWADPNNRISIITNARSDEYQQAVADSAASIATCGLNTCVETMRASMLYNIPVIFIPRFKGAYSNDQEQTFRAQKLDDLGISTIITPEHYSDPEKYIQRIEFADNRPVTANMNYQMDGAKNAALILSTIANHSVKTNIDRFREQRNIRPRLLQPTG